MLLPFLPAAAVVEAYIHMRQRLHLAEAVMRLAVVVSAIVGPWKHAEVRGDAEEVNLRAAHSHSCHIAGHSWDAAFRSLPCASQETIANAWLK